METNSFALRKKIEDGKIYVNKFLDNSRKIKNVRFIAPAFGYDMDCPKVVFRKTPRFILKTMDHFRLMLNTKEKKYYLYVVS